MTKPRLSLFVWGFFFAVLFLEVVEGWMTNSVQLTSDTASERSYLSLAIASYLKKRK